MSICPRDPAPWCKGQCLEPRTPTRVTEGSLTGISFKQPSTSGANGRPSSRNAPMEERLLLHSVLLAPWQTMPGKGSAQSRGAPSARSSPTPRGERSGRRSYRPTDCVTDTQSGGKVPLSQEGCVR